MALTAVGAARLLALALRESEYGKDGGAEDLFVRTPAEGAAVPTVVWESGPHEWAMCVTGGERLGFGEFPELGSSPQEPEIVEALKRVQAGGFYFEPVNMFSLAVYRV